MAVNTRLPRGYKVEDVRAWRAAYLDSIRLRRVLAALALRAGTDVSVGEDEIREAGNYDMAFLPDGAQVRVVLERNDIEPDGD